MKPLPMLAIAASPFDSPDYIFEVKWDGVRALAGVEEGHWQLWGRQGVDYTPRYPDLVALRRLPAGTIVDGELVVLRQGRADLWALLQRHQRHRPLRPSFPVPSVCYVLFDLLCYRGRSLLQEPLIQRRQRLRELLLEAHEPALVYSNGIVGSGRDFFAQVVAQGHEGVMAKHLASRYLAGKRSPAWRKIKPTQILPCVIVGYRPGRERHLLLATARGKVLRYVGEVARGFAAPAQAELFQRLALCRCPRPIVPCPRPACWVEPELYCRVQFQGWTSQGRLRHAVFRGLIEER